MNILYDLWDARKVIVAGGILIVGAFFLYNKANKELNNPYTTMQAEKTQVNSTQRANPNNLEISVNK